MANDRNYNYFRKDKNGNPEPNQHLTKKVKVGLDEETFAVLTALENHFGLRKAELIRRIIKHHLKERE